MSISAAASVDLRQSGDGEDKPSLLSRHWGWGMVSAGYAGTMYAQNDLARTLPFDAATNALVSDSSVLVLSMAMLVGGAKILGDATDDLAEKNNLSGGLIGFIIGLTSSMPELLVSYEAAQAGQFGIAEGNPFGSNIANPLFTLAIPMLLFGMKAANGSLQKMDYDNRWMLGTGVSIPVIHGLHELGPVLGLDRGITMDDKTGMAMLLSLMIYGGGKALGYDKPKAEKVLDKIIANEALPRLSDALEDRLQEIFGEEPLSREMVDHMARMQQAEGLSDDDIASFFKTFMVSWRQVHGKDASWSAFSKADLAQLEKRLEVPIAREFADFIGRADQALDMKAFADFLVQRSKGVFDRDPITHETLDEVEKKLGKTFSAEEREAFFSRVVLPAAKMGIGGAAVIKAADYVVSGGSGVAEGMGVDPSLVSLLGIALGTSLPEFVFNVSAFLRQQYGQAFGNVLASGTANILLIMGITSLFMDGDIPQAFQFLNEDGSLNDTAFLNHGFLLAATLYMGGVTAKAKELAQNPKAVRAVGAGGALLYAGYVAASLQMS